MLEAGEPAVEVMTEYVRACRHLGHAVPEPTSLRAAYTAEDGLDLRTLDADHRTLSETVAALENVLLLQEQARRALAAAWRGSGAEAAAAHLSRHAQSAEDAVDGLRASAVALGELRNRLWQLVDDKIAATRDIEARGMRAEWLSASRTVTTGAGDRAGASEMVDMQVAPFVAHDIGHDWVSAMRGTESAVRQAYRDAATAMTAQASAVFARPGLLGSVPVITEGVSAPAVAPAFAEGGAAPSAPAAVTPAGFNPGPPSPGAGPVQVPSVPAVAPATPLPPSPLAPDPVAPPSPGGPMPGASAPLGAGMSGLSGLGQSFADMLGGLLGAGEGPLGERLGFTGDLGSDMADDPDDVELDDPGEEAREEDDEDEDVEEDKDDDEDGPDEDESTPEEPVEPEAEVVPTESTAPVAVTPEPPVPTPVPEPVADPVVVAPAEPIPADTPCEIAADELPQAGP